MVRSFIGDIERVYDSQFMKRIKGFVWHAAMMALAFAISWMAQHLADLELPLYATTILGLLLGQISKYLNNGNVVQ